MKDLIFREALNNYVEENNIEEDCGDVLMLDNHAYDRSIVGITVDGKLVYDYEKMVEEFMDDEECDELEALEWLEYNTMRALPYMGERRPIILIENRDSLLEKYGGAEIIRERAKDEDSDPEEEDEEDFQYGHTR